MTPEEKKGAKILVVDDEPVARRLISSVLALHGYMTFEDAETGEAALEKLKKNKYQLVLLDKNMPGIDGIEGGGYRTGCPQLLDQAPGQRRGDRQAGGSRSGGG
jgi:hypothetical protein